MDFEWNRFIIQFSQETELKAVKIRKILPESKRLNVLIIKLWMFRRKMCRIFQSDGGQVQMEYRYKQREQFEFMVPRVPLYYFYVNCTPKYWIDKNKWY